MPQEVLCISLDYPQSQVELQFSRRVPNCEEVPFFFDPRALPRAASAQDQIWIWSSKLSHLLRFCGLVPQELSSSASW